MTTDQLNLHDRVAAGCLHVAKKGRAEIALVEHGWSKGQRDREDSPRAMEQAEVRKPPAPEFRSIRPAAASSSARTPTAPPQTDRRAIATAGSRDLTARVRARSSSSGYPATTPLDTDLGSADSHLAGPASVH